jgi:hypothetical protein
LRPGRGGPPSTIEAAVGILPSYDRYEMNPRTGKRKGYREPKARKAL